MKFSVINGNGAICDKCGKILRPDNIVKVRFQRKKKDDSTGDI